MNVLFGCLVILKYRIVYLLEQLCYVIVVKTRGQRKHQERWCRSMSFWASLVTPGNLPAHTLKKVPTVRVAPRAEKQRHSSWNIRAFS